MSEVDNAGAGGAGGAGSSGKLQGGRPPSSKRAKTPASHLATLRGVVLVVPWQEEVLLQQVR
jgi:hypothetical protein